MQISQSDLIRVRRARWRVLDVRGYAGCQILVAAGADPINAGVERRFVLPFDEAERIERRSQPVRVSGRRWRRACRQLLAANAPPGALIAARHARIDLLPHQLEPALAVVRGLGSRVLLADDVGLGKTVQSGLIVAELQARGAADRVLVVTPAGLRDQWAQELSGRFGINAAVVDARTLRQRAAVLPIGMNPWLAVPVAIASIDYVKRAEVVGAVGACPWDVLIVDEAHGVASDNDRHAAIAALAARAAYVVLASATPHNGDRRAFGSLCAIGETAGDELLVFRRSRRDVRIGGRRRVHRLHVRMDPDEAAMHGLLLRYSRAVRAQHRNSARGRDCWLALSVLHKRALSSASSLLRSIQRRLDALVDAVPHASQLDLPLGDSTGELTIADEPPVWPSILALDDVAEERRLLDAMSDAADRAAKHETKIRALGRLLRRVAEPAIVFTEFRDTLQHVQASLGLPCLMLHGGMHRAERHAVVERFTNGGARLLLATDAAAEGLNLHNACRLVVNLELPWNPMRLEQRIGRVDRIGQRRTVHAVHLIARGSAEAHLLARLRTRVAAVLADIGGADPLDQDLEHRSPAALSLPQNRSLERDSEAEAERLNRARAFAGACDEHRRAPVPNGPLIARCRRWKTRAALAGRSIMFWQVCAEDGFGRPAGSCLVPIGAFGPLPSGTDAALRLASHAALEWKAALMATHHAFIGTRLARERAIQAVGGGEVLSTSVVQSGLFERRLDRARLAIAAAEQAATRDDADRLAALERSRVLSYSAPQLHLLLTR